MSAAFATAEPHRIKAAHRRRRRIASGQSVQRYYDPAIGRFLSVDPVGPLQDPIQHFGRYHYAANNPYRFIDPDGRMIRNRHEAPGIGSHGTCQRINTCLGVKNDVKRAVTRAVTRAASRVVEGVAEGAASAAKQKYEEVSALVSRSDKVLKVGVSGQLAAGVVGNKVTSPSTGLTGGISLLVNPSSGQIGFQASWGVTAGLGGGATAGLEFGAGLNNGPLTSGGSSAYGSFITASEGPAAFGVSVRQQVGGSGGEISVGTRGSVGPYLGAGALYEDSYTVSSPPIW